MRADDGRDRPATAVAGDPAAVKSQLLSLRREILDSTVLPRQPAQSLLRLVDADLRSLSAHSPNYPYLRSLFLCLHHPSISAVSHLKRGRIACSFGGCPSWLVVSARSPAHLTWAAVRDRVDKIFSEASQVKKSPARPVKLVFVFARGIGADVSNGFRNELGASEVELGFEESIDGWVLVNSPSFRDWRAFVVMVGEMGCDVSKAMLEFQGVEEEDVELQGLFGNFCKKLKKRSSDGKVYGQLVNFDTTALIAVVSGISNGDATRLLASPEEKLRARFKCNYPFVITQAMSELENPILLDLEKTVSGKMGIVCETASTEFQELVSMCGGPDEKRRAGQLLKRLLVVPDSPSPRMNDLRTTRKLAPKNKVVFGTGDYWNAPTLSANSGFIRSVAQTGMSLPTIEHRPRALTGV